MSIPRRDQGRTRSASTRQPQRPVKQTAKQTSAKKKSVSAKPTSAAKKRQRSTRRFFRLIFVMACLFIGTFLLTAIVSGNMARVTQFAQGILTPSMPKLVIRDDRHEYKVSTLNRKNTRETKAFLGTSYEENQGILALNSEGSSVAAPQNQYPFQRHLSKISYAPQTLTITQSLSQKIAFSTPPSRMDTYAFYHDDVFLSNSLDDINAFLPDYDGLCYVLVDAEWDADRAWQMTRSGLYCFAIHYDRPAVFSINMVDVDPGELLVFYAEYLTVGESVAVQSNLPLSLQFSPYGRRQMIALAPISYDIRPGVYATTLSVGGANQSFDITVKDKEFAVQYVSMDPQIVAETRTEETNKEFQDKVNPILAEQTPELLWQGRAALPVPESRVLTLFGSRRYVNDDVNSYRHTGLDLEAPAGTEVRSVNHGKVLFAEYLAYTGNTILIEHGLGLKSWYYHLDELLVAPGDTVGKDEVIGYSGQTGFAAEPHLHLTLSVGSVYINPVTAINQPLFREPLP